MSRHRSSGHSERVTDDRVARGLVAEQLAAAHLEAAGLVVLAARFRCVFGEVDLVMRDVRELVFVEVRSRRPGSRIDPVETITPVKRRRLAQTAQAYLAAHRRYRRWPARFDVVGVSGDPERPQISWLRNAFTLDDLP